MGRTRLVSCGTQPTSVVPRSHARDAGPSGLAQPEQQCIVSRVETDLLLRQADEHDAQLARGESMGWMHGMPPGV
jgi:hypothetical protein